MKEIIFEILSDMAEELSVMQLKKLQEVLLKRLQEQDEPIEPARNDEYLEMFINAKKIEGCSLRTLKYYRSSVHHLFSQIETPVRKITTEQLREYLAGYQKINNCSKSTVDNIRRNISSFFSWLEEENYILKSPMRRIHKIKTNQQVKEVISDEDIEKMKTTVDIVKEDMIKRDVQDSTREDSPLTKVVDAIEIDTTNNTVEDTTNVIINILKEKGMLV